MPVKHKIFFGLAALHLMMIAVFAAHLGEWSGKSKIIRSVGKVGDFTGSNNIFSFFAPGLSDQPYVIYGTKDQSGKEHVIDLKGRSADFTNRLNNVYGFMTLEEGRGIFSASLAQFISRQYPTAQQIKVAMVVQKIPTMQQYRD